MEKQVMTEEHGKYKGYDYEIKLFSDGHRTGYVRIPWKTQTFDYIDEDYWHFNIGCHGGITYDAYCDSDDGFLPEGFWIGFDCCHLGDYYDMPAAERAFGKPACIRYEHTYYPSELEDTQAGSLAFCRNECQSIIEQVILLDEPVKTIAVALTEEQVETLLAILDCETKEEEPDWFFDRESEKVKTPFAEKEKERSVQEHLDKILKRENFPEIF